MDIILGDGDRHFTPFDMFAHFTDSKGKTIQQLIAEFKTLRAHNIDRLKEAGLTETMLDRTGIHPAFGTVTLRHMLSSWVVHDLSHINQITRVMARQYENEVGPWTEYMTILKR
jgi:hypothetical protein